MNYVIIGNSISGTSAVEAIRNIDKKGNITLVSDESHLNYSRPLISYLLAKKISVEKSGYQNADFYRKNGVNLILNNKAEKLLLKNKTVILSDKTKVPFDRLLIATGGIPVIPAIKGRGTGGVFTFTKLKDAEEIERYINKNKVKNAVVIGGGLIGLKATEALIEFGIKVTIVELADRILSATFDRKASAIIETALGKMGCRVIKKNTVREIKTRNGRVREVMIKNGKKVPADLVIAAIGVRPNIALAEGTPIKIDRGILVDKHMRTSVEDIYAAGDCCQAIDMLSDTDRTIAVWPVAARTGKIAGFNMAGSGKKYTGGFPMNSVELAGVPTVSAGETNITKGAEVLEYANEGGSIYKKIVLKSNKIVGVIFVGKIERSGIYLGIIRNKIDVSAFKEYLLKDDFGLIYLPLEYRKHLIKGEQAIL